MNLTDWMLANLPTEVITGNAHPKLARRLADLAAEVWAEGFQAACDETPISLTPDGPTDVQNPYVENTNRAPDKCVICGDKATLADGTVGVYLCESDPCFVAAWDIAFPEDA